MAFAFDDELQSAEERLALEAALAFMDSELHSAATGSSSSTGTGGGGSSAHDASASLLPDYLFGDELHQQLNHHQHPQQQPALRADQELQLFDISGSEPEGELFSLEALTAGDAALDELSFRFGSSDASVSSPPPAPVLPKEEDGTNSAITSTAQPRPKWRQKSKQQTATATADTKRKPTPKANTDSKSTLTTTPTASRTERRKPLNYNPNKARDERREELIYLRGKVQELETQLDDIKQKRPRITASALAPTLAVSSSPASSSSMYAGFMLANATKMGDAAGKVEPEPLEQQQQQLVVAGVWQDIATRQCEGRIKAERENIRLKIILENQIKIAKSLEKLLKKKVAARDIEHCPQCQQLHHVYPPTKDPRTDAQIFEDLAAGVELSYKEVDSVFAANGLAQMEIPHSDARMRSDDAHGMFLELLANKVLPFDVHATATAAWHYFVYAKQRTPSRSYFFDSPKNADTTDDTITENFSLGLHANSTSAHFRVKQVLRRFVEEDRVVIVWRSHVEPVEFSDEPLSGLRFRERGYIVIKRPRTLSGDYTLVQTCYIFTPNFTGDLSGGDDPKVGAITDFVLSATAANITASHQMIENVLIEQAMKKNDGGLAGATVEAI